MSEQEYASDASTATVYADFEKRAPMPQACSCSKASIGSDSDGGTVTLASPPSTGIDGMPTFTTTMTLYSAGETTSTRSEGSASSDGTEGTTNSQSLSLNAAPFMGVAVTSATYPAQANPTIAGTSTTTGTSTIYNTITVTSTSISTTTVHDSSSTEALISLIGSNPTSQAVSSTRNTKSPQHSSGSASDASKPSIHGGAVAGAVIGSMAAFAIIGLLLWYCCFKRKVKRKIKINSNLKRRKSSSAKTPQSEDQSMEEMRRMMIDKHQNVNDFLKVQPATSNDAAVVELPGDIGLRRNLSQTDRSRTHPSWIGVAVSSNTPPDTPPLPRANSQRSARMAQSTAASVGFSEGQTGEFGPQRRPIPPSLLPAPLKPVYKPAPIITSPSLARPEHVSPLSPRGMFNAISNSTSTAWKRASQVLSPGGYQRIAEDGSGGGQNTKRRDSKPRNPELEIGHQTDGGWNGRWI